MAHHYTDEERCDNIYKPTLQDLIDNPGLGDFLNKHGMDYLPCTQNVYHNWMRQTTKHTCKFFKGFEW